MHRRQFLAAAVAAAAAPMPAATPPKPVVRPLYHPELMVRLNGVLQYEGDDYDVCGATIKLTFPAAKDDMVSITWTFSGRDHAHATKRHVELLQETNDVTNDMTLVITTKCPHLFPGETEKQ